MQFYFSLSFVFFESQMMPYGSFFSLPHVETPQRNWSYRHIWFVKETEISFAKRPYNMLIIFNEMAWRRIARDKRRSCCQFIMPFSVCVCCSVWWWIIICIACDRDSFVEDYLPLPFQRWIRLICICFVAISVWLTLVSIQNYMILRNGSQNITTTWISWYEPIFFFFQLLNGEAHFWYIVWLYFA